MLFIKVPLSFTPYTILRNCYFSDFLINNLICDYRYSGGGFVKKSFPFPKLSLQRRRRLMALGSSRERMLRKHKKREKVCADGTIGKLQGVREARYRKARKLLKNAIAKVRIKIFGSFRD